MRGLDANARAGTPEKKTNPKSGRFPGLPLAQASADPFFLLLLLLLLFCPLFFLFSFFCFSPFLFSSFFSFFFFFPPFFLFLLLFVFLPFASFFCLLLLFFLFFLLLFLSFCFLLFLFLLFASFFVVIFSFFLLLFFSHTSDRSQTPPCGKNERTRRRSIGGFLIAAPFEPEKQPQPGAFGGDSGGVVLLRISFLGNPF